ncbi:MAG: N-glycanase, partial [Bacteroidales bacterium]|nr:N-glycanase [Bacteroidales bacterium]
MKRIFYFLILAVIVTSCQTELKEMGSRHIILFEQEPVHFSPGKYDGPVDLNSTGLVRIMDGRILLRKVNLPVYQREVKATLRITFSSGGDPWDKSGSCFIIPASQEKNILTIFNGEHQFPESGESVEGFRGIVADGNFVPTFELMRFMTPFGAISERTRKRRPVYIPHWEEEVTWEVDITDRMSLLEGDFWIGIWADTWTSEGFIFSAELIIEESPWPCAKKTETEVLSLLNTVY